MFIDTHTHISLKYYNNIDSVIKSAVEKGVTTMIVSCCDRESIIEAVNIFKNYNNIFLTVGFHPDEIYNITGDTIDWLRNIIAENKKIIGIGEIGLDYHYSKEEKELQQKLFRAQLSLASELNLPVVIHTRDATGDTLKILKEYELRGIIHCFSGSLETAKEYVKLGYLLGIGGIVTFKNNKLADILLNLPIENLVLETDSPYLCPEPNRGMVNESKNVVLVAKKLSEIKKISIDEVGKITTDNVTSLFDFDI